MMASTLDATKFWISLSCLLTSLAPSSTCSVTLGSVLAYSIMPFLSTVRKLSLNWAMATPIVVACAALLIMAAANAVAIITFFTFVFLHFGASGGALIFYRKTFPPEEGTIASAAVDLAGPRHLVRDRTAP